MMERFGLVLVATFAAGMFCGPLFCVIYSRSRRHRKLKPGPRQLRNARRQLVSVAECSARLGAQRWEMAMGAGARRGSGPRSGSLSRAAETGTEAAGASGSDMAVGGGDVVGHPHRPSGGAGHGDDDDDNDCPICIGPLFPRHDRDEAPDTRLSATYASSTQACINNGRDGTAGGGRGHGMLTAWARSLRRHLRGVPSMSSSSSFRPQQQPEMSSAGHGLPHRLLLSGRPWRQGHPRGGEAEGRGRVQTDVQERTGCNGHNDTPDSAPSPNHLMTTMTSPPGGDVDAADAVAAACISNGEGGHPEGKEAAGATGVSQGGNVLEDVHDSDAKTRMTPVYLASSTTGSLSAPSAARGGDAKTARHSAQPLTSTIDGDAAAHLTAPGPGAAAGGGAAAAAISPPRSSISPRSTESGRGEPNLNLNLNTATPRRPAAAVVRRAAATVVDVLSPSRGVRRASLMQQRHDGDDEEDTDDDSGTSDLDTEILVLQGCKHAFHARCLATWFLADGFDCPVCRSPYWMRRERMARALQNERNGLPLDHGEEELRARALAGGYFGAAGGTTYSAIGGAIVVVRAPARTYSHAADRRAWEVYLP